MRLLILIEEAQMNSVPTKSFNNAVQTDSINPPLLQSMDPVSTPSHASRQQKGGRHKPSPANAKDESRVTNALEDKVDGLLESMEVLQYKQSISKLRNDLEISQQELHQALSMSKVLRTNWQKETTELLHSRSQGQFRDLLPDGDLVQAVSQLRYLIRSFAIEYSAKIQPEILNGAANKKIWKYMLETIASWQQVGRKPKPRIQNEVLIQSFIWRLLIGEVFENFYWIPNLQDSMRELCKALQPSK